MERLTVPGGDAAAALRSNEWKAVPDIWRSSAEKYGDRVAVVDPYHDPPSTFTYRQVKFLIYQFLCKALRDSLVKILLL